MNSSSSHISTTGYADLPTPCLIVDLDGLEANIALMAQFAKSHGINLRPHAKTHKCSDIARRQISAGALGVSCSTIDEAETMVEAGIRGVLVTSPIVGPGKIARFVKMIRLAADTRTVVDNARAVQDLDAALAAEGLTAGVLIDIDVGQHRTGVQPADALALAQVIAALPALRLEGLQAYAGHVQHITDDVERLEKARGVHDVVRGIRAQLAPYFAGEPIISGSGTGTHAFDVGVNAFTELQAGSYVFMDVEYGAIVPPTYRTWPFETSLRLLTTVVSAPIPGQVTTDAGTKSLATFGPLPRVMTDAYKDCTYNFSGDEHGRLTFPSDVTPPVVGTRLEVIVGHCDPTVALFDRLYGMRDGKLVKIIAVDARGRKNRMGLHQENLAEV